MTNNEIIKYNTARIDYNTLDMIASCVRDRVFIKSKQYKTSIFLCGADILDKSKFRQKIASRVFSRGMRRYFYDLLYPEELFEDFLYRSNQFNLLKLEDILARSVDTVIVIPESPGSFTELGAFASNERLRKKLICIVDEKYRKQRSFLNYGPIALVKQENKKNVIYMDFSDNVTEEEEKLLLSAVNRIKKNKDINEKQLHFLQLEDYLIPLIYILEPISLDEINRCIKSVLSPDEDYKASCYASLQLLMKKKYITLRNDEYFLSQIGLKYYHNFLANNSKKDKFVVRDELDNIRVEVLNYKLRGKPVRL